MDYIYISRQLYSSIMQVFKNMQVTEAFKTINQLILYTTPAPDRN
jgi:hypothetical protein